MAENLDEAALEYHRFPTPGKISVTPTKNLANQRDLAARLGEPRHSGAPEIAALKPGVDPGRLGDPSQRFAAQRSPSRPPFSSAISGPPTRPAAR